MRCETKGCENKARTKGLCMNCYQKKYRVENKEKMKEAVTKWYEKHPDYQKNYRETRREKKAQATKGIEEVKSLST